MNSATNYRYDTASPAHTASYLWPTVIQSLNRIVPPGGSRRIFDLGCGNGATAAFLSQHGYEVFGVDPSKEGIAIANHEHPDLRLELGSCDDDLAGKYGQFPLAISLEVIEHVYLPRKFARSIFDLLEPGGTALISTPYHGYVKNLALALTGKLDAHFTALWDYGHIKFWSRQTISTLLRDAGLEVGCIHRVGRIPALAKSMIVMARKPIK